MPQESLTVPAKDVGSERVEVQFRSGSERCGAWLFLPRGSSSANKVPVIVMGHGLSGVKEMCLAAYAERFRDAGYACLVFDFRYFGSSSGEPRELADVPKQLEDWRAAVTFARSIPEIDPERVITWGTSFSGGHVIVTAADDARIAAAITQCPFTDGPATGSTIDWPTKLRLVARALQDAVASMCGQEPVRIHVVGRPGEVALLTTPDALPGMQALLHASGMQSMRDSVPARIVFQLLRYRPGARAKDVRCPILFCVCARDSVAPAPATIRHAEKAIHGQINRYPDAHFEIYVGDAMERLVSDQLAFLKKHVPV